MLVASHHKTKPTTHGLNIGLFCRSTIQALFWTPTRSQNLAHGFLQVWTVLSLLNFLSSTLCIPYITPKYSLSSRKNVYLFFSYLIWSCKFVTLLQHVNGLSSLMLIRRNWEIIASFYTIVAFMSNLWSIWSCIKKQRYAGLRFQTQNLKNRKEIGQPSMNWSH